MDGFSEFCRVGDDGIAHLFEGLEYGAACACGRKFIALDAGDERICLADAPWDDGLRLVPCVGQHRVPYEVELWRSEAQLARGAREIQRAREARRSAGALFSRAHTTARRTERILQDVLLARGRRREARPQLLPPANQ